MFRRAVVAIPPKPDPTAAGDSDLVSPAAAFAAYAVKKAKPGSSGGTETTIGVYHPEDAHAARAVRAALGTDPQWTPVKILCSLPYVDVEVVPEGAQPGSGTHTVMLLVDTGAGGMSAVFNAATARKLGILDSGNGSGSRRALKGVGGGAASSLTVSSGMLGTLRVGGAEFSSVKCMVAGEGAGGGVELSHYTAGILCGDLLSQCHVVVDLPRKRICIT